MTKPNTTHSDSLPPAVEDRVGVSAIGRPASPFHAALPDEPVVTIQPGRSRITLGLRELWAYRELLYFLTWRDVKVRYKQTLLGAAWAIMQPLLAMLVFTFFFGKLAGVPSDNIPYPIFVYAGLLPWTFFSNAITNGGNSLVGNTNLITKVYFPRMMVPAAAVVAGLVDFAVAFALLLGLMTYYQVGATWQVFLLPALVLLNTLLAFGVGMWLAALNVKYRDVRFALPFLTQLWMFLSPVIYPASFLPERWQWTMRLNPLTGIIEGYRAALFALPINWTSLLMSLLITSGVLFYAMSAFRRMERSFADII